MTSRVVLVTGASGFLGRHVAEALAREEFTVVLTSRTPGLDIDHVQDLADIAGVRSMLRRVRPSAIIHAAGATGGPAQTLDHLVRTNVTLTDRLLVSVKEEVPNCVTFVASSSSVYAPSDLPLDETCPIGPVTRYGVSKAAQELTGGVARHAGTAVAIMRFFNLVGPRQPATFMLSALARQVAEREMHRDTTTKISIGRLDSRRDFVDVRDAAQAVVRLLRSGAEDGIYNVSSGRATSVEECVGILRDLAAIDFEVSSRSSVSNPGDVDVQVGDSAKLKNSVGWRPTIPLRETVAALLNQWRRDVGG